MVPISDDCGLLMLCSTSNELFQAGGSYLLRAARGHAIPVGPTRATMSLQQLSKSAKYSIACCRLLPSLAMNQV